MGTVNGLTGALVKQGSGTFTLGGDCHAGGADGQWAASWDIGTGTTANTASFESADIASGATLYVAQGATLTIRIPKNITNNGHLINDGTVNDDLANNGAFGQQSCLQRQRGQQYRLINNNTPGVWTGQRADQRPAPSTTMPAPGGTATSRPMPG